MVEIFSINRLKVNDVEIQNNNNNSNNINNNLDDLKSSKDSVLTRDLEIIKHKNKQGKFIVLFEITNLNNFFRKATATSFGVFCFKQL